MSLCTQPVSNIGVYVRYGVALVYVPYAPIYLSIYVYVNNL